MGILGCKTPVNFNRPGLPNPLSKEYTLNENKDSTTSSLSPKLLNPRHFPDLEDFGRSGPIRPQSRTTKPVKAFPREGTLAPKHQGSTKRDPSKGGSYQVPYSQGGSHTRGSTLLILRRPGTRTSRIPKPSKTEGSTLKKHRDPNPNKGPKS